MTDANRDIARQLARKYGVLNSDGLDILTNLLQPLRVKRGVKILEAGKVCQNIYYVYHGLVRQYYNIEGKIQTEHIAYEDGMVMCLESLFNSSPSHLTIETMEPSLLYAIPFEPLRALTRQRLDFCEIFIKILEESLVISQKKANTLRFESARNRYLRTLNEHPDIIRRAPLHIVANYLRMTPETLSRIRTALSKESH